MLLQRLLYALVASLALFLSAPSTAVATDPGCIYDPKQGLGGTFHPVRWTAKDFPIMLGADDGLSLDLQVQLLSAVHVWNQIVGLEVFRIVPWLVELDPPISRLVPVSATAKIDGSYTTLGQTQIASTPVTGHVRGASVVLRSDLVGPKAFQVAVHELGHVLGLAHDVDDSESVMFPHMIDVAQYLYEEDAQYVRSQLTCVPHKE